MAVKLKTLLVKEDAPVINRGTQEAQKIIDNVRAKVLRNLNDAELDAFIDAIALAFDLERK